ncbi:MAG: hypothetical protein DRQ54_09030 [Gammaproteobacteria bacterium]|nr:MAG: hypothetical protein DRQ54_09030 [Gammaproteobacteria bacterium]RLA12962.1 MAG: hypothetical protein DRQ52_07105 [Gammaproteobacteria bacterium]
MSDQPEQENAQAEAAAADAVEQGIDITAAVRDITLQALSKGKLDTDKIRGVVRSVVSGAGEGAEKQEGPGAVASLREALSGVDEALANSVQASRLAIEEAAGHVGEFSNSEFKRAVEDLRTLEELFLSTVKDAAASSGQRVKQTLNDFVDHAKISGTAVGKAATDSVSLLSRQLGSLLMEAASEGADTALRVGSQLSQAAAGFLDGIAGSLQARSEKRDKKD